MSGSYTSLCEICCTIIVGKIVINFWKRKGLYCNFVREKNRYLTRELQKDSMETLAACAPVYGASVFLPLIDEVFDALKVEVSDALDNSLSTYR